MTRIGPQLDFFPRGSCCCLRRKNFSHTHPSHSLKFDHESTGIKEGTSNSDIIFQHSD